MEETLNQHELRTMGSNYVADINNLKVLCHVLSTDAGWWDNPNEIGTKLMLIVSEIAEAMEGHRKGLNDDHLPHRPMIEVELADAIIRICDLAGYLKLDIGGAILEKLKYNQQREDHKPENRAKSGGKSY